MIRARTTILTLTGWLVLLGSLAYCRVPLNDAAWTHPLSAAACIAAAMALTWVPGLDELRARVARWIYGASLKMFCLFLFVATVLMTVRTSFSLFQGVPHMDDSVAALFQARIFLQGGVTLPAPQNWDFFRQYAVLGPQFGLSHWCSMYPPGWPLLLAVGEALGAPWLMNPVLTGGIAVLVVLLGRELHEEHAGRTAGLLVFLSPFAGVIGATHLSHTATAFLCLLCWWSVLRMLEHGKMVHGLIAGASLGLAFLCRPLPAVVVGVTVAVGALVQYRRLLVAWRAAALAVLLVAGALGIQLWYQHQITGDFLTAGHTLALGTRGRMGFGRFDSRQSHSVAEAIDFTLRRGRALNQHLLGWPIASFLFCLFPLLRGRARWKDGWLLLPLLGLVALFACFWYWEEFYPGRYLYEATPFLLLLGAAGLHAFLDDPGTRGGLARVARALVLGSVLFAVVRGTREYHKHYDDNHGDVEAVLPRVVEEYGITNAVVFIDAYEYAHHFEGTFQDALWRTRRWSYSKHNDYYATGFMLNDIDLEGDIIFARRLVRRADPRECYDELVAAYPGRRYYLYRYNRGAGRAILAELVLENGRVSETGTKWIRPQPGCRLLMPD